MHEYLEYLRAVNAYRSEHGVRMGQAYFTVLDHFRWTLAEMIAGTDLDPYYDDQTIPEFLTYVCEAMSKG